MKNNQKQYGQEDPEQKKEESETGRSSGTIAGRAIAIAGAALLALFGSWNIFANDVAAPPPTPDIEIVSQENIENPAKESVEDFLSENIAQPSQESSETVTSDLCFRNEKLLQDHYEKHGIEMGFADAKAYEDAARSVVLNSESLHKIEAEDGDDVYYLESTNEFVIVSTDGYLRTYYKPRNGKAYFDKQ